MPDHFLHTAPVPATVGFGMLEAFSCLVLLVSLHRLLTLNFSSLFLRLLVLLAFALAVRTSYESSYGFSRSSQLFASSASRAQSITALHPAYTAPSWWSHVYSSCSKWWVSKLGILMEANDLIPWIPFYFFSPKLPLTPLSPPWITELGLHTLHLRYDTF